MTTKSKTYSMPAHVNVGDSTQYVLKQALLIYQAQNQYESSPATAVSVHDVVNLNGHPTLGPGQPITRPAVESLAAALGRNLESGYLPANVVSLGFNQIAWWCPGAKRRIWFKPDGRFNGGREEQGREKTESMKTFKLNGKFVWHPPLLFIAARQLRVFALARNERPAADSPVYRAPYWNLWEDGGMCNGNRAMSSHTTPASIPGYEDAFFNSAFSHTNITRLCRHPKGHYGLWLDLSKARKQPDTKYWQANLSELNGNLAKVLANIKE